MLSPGLVCLAVGAPLVGAQNGEEGETGKRAKGKAQGCIAALTIQASRVPP